jgi:hypothetical protein
MANRSKKKKCSRTRALDNSLTGLPIRRLANSLGLTDRWLRQFVIHLPNGSLFIRPRAQWCILIKAVVEQFCAKFAPSGVVLCIRDGESKFVYLKTEYLERLGVKLPATAKIPDIVIHDAERNWLVLIEVVSAGGPVDGKRRKELKDLFGGCKAGLVFVTAFHSREAMRTFLAQISWETEVWVADDPDHLIHFDGNRFLGPYAEAKK